MKTPQRWPARKSRMIRALLLYSAFATCLLQFRYRLAMTSLCCEGKSRQLGDFLVDAVAISQPASHIHGLDVVRTDMHTNRKLQNDKGINASSFVVDMLSTGSELMPDLHAAQRETFGSHPQVRIFYAAEEKDDFDPECHKSLSVDDVIGVVKFCRKDQPEKGSYSEIQRLREEYLKTAKFPWLFDMQDHFMPLKKMMKKDNPPGWLCAQTRPISALGKLVRRYKQEALPLPDYLFLIDDDTYVNVDRTLAYLTKNYPPDKRNVVAGCLLSWVDKSLSVPWGGYGTILSKASLERLIRPLSCAQHVEDVQTKSFPIMTTEDRKNAVPTNLTDYEEFACLRILENRADEQQFFSDGMSLLDLFETYAREQPFREYRKWNETGFCLHSDTLTGYMVNTYEIGGYEPDNNPVTKVIKTNHFQTYEGSVFHYGSGSPRHLKTGNRCYHKHSKCTEKDSHICHYVNGTIMRSLHSAL